MYICSVDSKKIEHVFAEQFAKTSFQIRNTSAVYRGFRRALPWLICLILVVGSSCGNLGVCPSLAHLFDSRQRA